MLGGGREVVLGSGEKEADRAHKCCVTFQGKCMSQQEIPWAVGVSGSRLSSLALPAVAAGE